MTTGKKESFPKPLHLSDGDERLLLVLFYARYTLGLLAIQDPEYQQQGRSMLAKQGLSPDRALALFKEEDESAAVRYVLSKIPGINLTEEEIEKSSRLMEDNAIQEYITERFGGLIIDNTGISIGGVIASGGRR